jgi:hypothetical protein
MNTIEDEVHQRLGISRERWNRGPVALSAGSSPLENPPVQRSSADDPKLRDVAANADKICVTVESRTPRGASEASRDWYSKKVDGMIREGKQTEAFHLLKTVQGNLSKIVDGLLQGDDSILKILEKFTVVLFDGRRVGFDLHSYLEQPDDSPEALAGAIDSVMALSAGGPEPSVEEEVRRRMGISEDAWFDSDPAYLALSATPMFEPAEEEVRLRPASARNGGNAPTANGRRESRGFSRWLPSEFFAGRAASFQTWGRQKGKNGLGGRLCLLPALLPDCWCAP